jgi:hypothetical protein
MEYCSETSDKEKTISYTDPNILHRLFASGFETKRLPTVGGCDTELRKKEKGKGRKKKTEGRREEKEGRREGQRGNGRREEGGERREEGGGRRKEGGGRKKMGCGRGAIISHFSPSSAVVTGDWAVAAHTRGSKVIGLYMPQSVFIWP